MQKYLKKKRNHEDSAVFFVPCVANYEVCFWLCHYCIPVNHNHFTHRASVLFESWIRGKPWSQVSTVWPMLICRKKTQQQSRFPSPSFTLRHLDNYCMCNPLFSSFSWYHANISTNELIKIKGRFQWEK